MDRWNSVNRTFGDFLDLTGIPLPTREQFMIAGIPRVPVKKGWVREFREHEMSREAWDKLLDTLKPLSVDKLKEGIKIYVISNSKNHKKIGSTKNVLKRLNSLQCGNSEPLTLQRVYMLDDVEADCRKIEKWLHSNFTENSLMGEWFDEGLSVTDIDRLVHQAGGKIVYNICS